MAKTLLRIVCIAALITCTGVVFAQNIVVSGYVTSDTEEEPLLGVNILVKDSQSGTITGLDGDFEIEVATGTTLVFSYIGYLTQEIVIGSQAVLQIVLVSDAQVLEGVVVTGYKTVIKSDVAGSISSVKAKDIEKLPVMGFDQALQGQVAGLQVTQATGAPGDDIAVRIRGAGTLGNNDPLYVIDGVPTTGDINMFSTSDIESIEVLKDGSAAAIYGARAGNGVIVITTKKGQKGAPRFSAQSYYGFQQANRLPDLLNSKDYLTIRNEAIDNANVLRDTIRQIPLYDPSILDTLPDMDWLSEVFRTAPIQKYSLSASGGGDNGSFYIMGEYFDQEGVFKGQGFEKFLLRFNGDMSNDWIKVGNNISLSFSSRDVIGSSGDGAGPGNELSGIRYALIAAPVFKKTYEDGSYVPTSAFLGDPILYGDGNANPVAFIESTNWNIQRYRIFGNVFAEIQIFKDLKFRTNLGIDLLFSSNPLFLFLLILTLNHP